MRSIEGVSVIVTGGGSGLGAATAAHLASRGARVTICGRRPEKVKYVAESIGPNCAWVQADIDDPDDRARIIDTALEHGGIDVLVNNAGNRYVAPLAEIEEKEVADHYQTSVISPIMLSQLALPHLVERKGSIIFVGSVDVRRALPDSSVFASTKAAVHRLTFLNRLPAEWYRDPPWRSSRTGVRLAGRRGGGACHPADPGWAADPRAWNGRVR